jgi:hypothetical protein
MSDFMRGLETQQDIDPLFGQARLGQEAEEFLTGNLGKHLQERAERDIEQAYMALSECDPFDSARVAHLQLKIRAARAGVQWIAETINQGRVAEQSLRERDYEE